MQQRASQVARSQTSSFPCHQRLSCLSEKAALLKKSAFLFVFTETYNPNICIYVGVRALLKGEYELLPVRDCCQYKEQKKSGFCYGREKAMEWPLKPWRNQQSGDLCLLSSRVQPTIPPFCLKNCLFSNSLHSLLS